MRNHLLSPLIVGASLLASPWLASGFQDQTPGILSSRIDGPDQERVLDSITDAAGNFYVVGSFSSAEGKVEVFGDNADAPTGTVSQRGSSKRLLNNGPEGTEDIMVIKYDDEGVVQWARSFGGSGNDYATGIHVDGAGQVFITGSFSGNANFGGFDLDATFSAVNGPATNLDTSNASLESQLFVTMLDAGGTVQWVKPLEFDLVNQADRNEVAKINFQPSSYSPTPSGYIADTGEGYGSRNGQTYGWVGSPGGSAVSAEASPVDGQQSFTELQKTMMQFDGWVSNIRQSNRDWEIQLPNGTYEVRMATRFQAYQATSPPQPYTDPNLFAMSIEGQVYRPAHISSLFGSSYSNVINVHQTTITVSDGRLTISDNSLLNLSGLARNGGAEICYIEITEVGSGPVAANLSGALSLRSGTDRNMRSAIIADPSGHLYIKGEVQDNSLSSSTSSYEVQMVPPSGAPFRIAALPSGGSIQNDRGLGFIARLKFAKAGVPDPTGTSSPERDESNWDWDWIMPISASVTGSRSEVTRMLADGQGNIWATGWWKGSLTAGSSEVFLSNSDFNGFLIRMRQSDGRRLAHALINGAANSDVQPTGLAMDTDGNLIVSGNFDIPYENEAGALTLTPSADDATPEITLPNNGTKDGFVAKASPAAEWIWARSLGGISIPLADESGSLALDRPTLNDLVLDSTGNAYVTGAHSVPGKDRGPYVAQLSSVRGTNPQWMKIQAPEPGAGTEDLRLVGVSAGSASAVGGGTFQPDAEYFTGGSNYSFSGDVAGTSLDDVYQTQRFLTSGSMTFALDALDGDYQVTLKFATDVPNDGSKFTIENQAPVSINLDDLGGTLQAIDLVYDVTVSDGELTITFEKSDGADYGSICGIEVVRRNSPPNYHGARLALNPCGTLLWTISAGRYTHIHRQLRGTDTVDGFGDSGADYVATQRTGASDFDETEYYGSLIFPVDLDLKPLPEFCDLPEYFVGQIIEPGPNAFTYPEGHPKAGATPQPIFLKAGTEDVLPNAGSYFHWDSFSNRLYAVSPIIADVRWQDDDNLSTITGTVQTVTVRWPVPNASPPEPLQTHVVKVNPGSAAQPPVDLEPENIGYTFAQQLFSSAGGSITGDKVFTTTGEGWSTLLYVAGTNAAPGSAPVKVVPVHTVSHQTGLVTDSTDAVIGRALDPTKHMHWNDPDPQWTQGFNPDALWGFVTNTRAPIDAAFADSAFDMTERRGRIIPVNQDNPATPADNLVVIWSSRDVVGANGEPSIGVAWPTTPIHYDNIAWPANPEKIIIASGVGSEIELFGEPSSTGGVIAVNCGGPEVNVGGQVFAADTGVGGSAVADASTEAQALDAIYQTRRQGTRLEYHFPTGPGAFRVALHFSETPPADLDALPSRATTATVEGDTLVSNMEVLREAGDYYTPHVITLDVKVADANLDLILTNGSGFDAAQIHAIVVTPSLTFAQEKLDPAKFQSPRIYHQPDRMASGFNPNEEHALLVPSQNSNYQAAFALRTDLNHRGPAGTFTSDPYVLLKYQDATDNLRWKFNVYRVLLEDTITVGTETHPFDFGVITGFAGKRVQAPYPLSLLPDHPLTGYIDPPGTNAFFQDHKGAIWARSKGNIIAQFYYAAQPNFWYDTNGDGVEDDRANIPWLEFLTAAIDPDIGTPETQPVKTIYQIEWPPFVPKLFVGETLRNPKRGLPGVFNWATGSIIFDENEAAISNLEPGAPGSDSMLNLTARLIDSTSERWIPFDAQVAGQFLTDLAGNDLGLPVAFAENGRYLFPDLPPHLKPRIRFDPINRRLIFRGYIDESNPAAVLELLNVLSTTERDEAKAITTASAWSSAIDTLYTLTRNPNGVDTTGRILGVSPGDLLIGLDHRRNEEGAVISTGDIVPETARGGVALTAGLTLGTVKEDGERIGYLTLAENNDPALGAAPVALHVVKVVQTMDIGSVRVVLSDNPLDEKVTVRHAWDFGGDPDKLLFEWYYQPDANGRPAPTDVPPGGWISLGTGVGLNSLTIEGSGLRTLADNWIYCRFRLADSNNPDGLAYRTTYPVYDHDDNPGTADIGRFAGDPSFVSQNAPMFVPGWIKRVLEGINPFEQRVKNFHSAPTTTYITMLEQIGTAFEGAVALNSDPDSINQVGLLALYETVLRRGFDLSINGIPQATNGAVNNSLLLAASRISDFYMLLGNEAYADSQDPTIGFNVGTDGDFGSVTIGSFAFQNQRPSLMSEELALLRGRDDSATGVQAAPFYNRLPWNFSSGLEGEPAYVLNYQITDRIGDQETGLPDGFIREDDAATMYPMGHGDAWGHYLSAAKSYYRLLRHHKFTWQPRAEYTLIAGVPVAVDYLDEVKFARAAAARAKAAESLVDLTYRSEYTADPAGQWQGYKDVDSDRAWGVDEWARRAGQGALLDWMVATAILPEEDNDTTLAAAANAARPAGAPPVTQFNETSLDRIDRSTITELREIRSAYLNIQAVADRGDRGLNPLGLHSDVIPFDIDPSINEIGDDGERSTHFEQIYSRAKAAAGNALSAFEQANLLTERLRSIQISSEEFRQESEEAEFDLRNRLIEIFGYPYAGDIGPGKTYPTGYNGPDIYKWMYVDVAEVSGDAARLAVQQGGNNIDDEYQRFTGFFRPMDLGIVDGDNGIADTVGAYFPQDVTGAGGDYAPEEFQGQFSGEPLEIEYDLSTRRWAFQATPAMGQRRAPGSIQLALNEMLQAEAELVTAISNYGSLVSEIEDELELLEAQYGVQQDQLKILTDRAEKTTVINGYLAATNSAKSFVEQGADLASDLSDTGMTALPKSIIAGLASGGDITAPARAVISASSNIVQATLRATVGFADATINTMEFAKEQTELWTDLEIEKLGFDFEIQERLKGIEQTMRNEVTTRLELFQLEQALRGAGGEFMATLAEGQRIMEERSMFRRRIAGPIQQLRYQDIAFRNFRNEALQRYKATFDMAARYAFISAKVYDYETTLLGSSQKSGRNFLTNIVKQRSLGIFDDDGEPVHGVDGLSDPLARLSSNFRVLKGQLGFNNPQQETGQFSLRHELFRMRDSSDEAWQQVLADHVVDDLWQLPEFRRFCRPFAPEQAGPQPGMVIEFSSNVTFGLNHFGWPLAGGDSSYDSSNFATKIIGAGVWFEDYNGTGLATTPRVYLVPVGLDVMRSPTYDSLATREFNVVDQVLPTPFPIGNNDLSDPNFIPMNDSLDNSFAQIRRFSRFRAYHDNGDDEFPTDELERTSRLVGRSVWNTRWMLIIPGGTLLNDPEEGLKVFISGQKVPGNPDQRDGIGISDIKLFFETYAYSGI